MDSVTLPDQTRPLRQFIGQHRRWMWKQAALSKFNPVIVAASILVFLLALTYWLFPVFSPLWSTLWSLAILLLWLGWRLWQERPSLQQSYIDLDQSLQAHSLLIAASELLLQPKIDPVQTLLLQRARQQLPQWQQMWPQVTKSRGKNRPPGFIALTLLALSLSWILLLASENQPTRPNPLAVAQDSVQANAKLEPRPELGQIMHQAALASRRQPSTDEASPSAPSASRPSRADKTTSGQRTRLLQTPASQEQASPEIDRAVIANFSHDSRFSRAKSTLASDVENYSGSRKTARLLINSKAPRQAITTEIRGQSAAYDQSLPGQQNPDIANAGHVPAQQLGKLTESKLSDAGMQISPRQRVRVASYFKQLNTLTEP